MHAHGTQQDMVWQMSFLGICDRADVGPEEQHRVWLQLMRVHGTLQDMVW